MLLQQTTVRQAAPYFERFVRRFPDIRALARSSEREVLKEWEGAGYYARARNLRAAAREVVGAHGGRLPRSARALRALPGFGPYISSAVASLAFGERVPALEANGSRVVARWMRLETPLPNPAALAALASELGAMLPRRRPGELNEAVMELGEELCRPRRPRCGDCPVSRWCRAYAELSDPALLPARRPRRRRPHLRAAVVALEREGRYLVQRRPSRGLLGGLWEFPGGKIRPGESPREAGRRELLEETGLEVPHLRPVGVLSHAYSHFTVEIHLFRGRLPPSASRGRPGRERRWLSLEQFERLPRPKATERAAALLRPPRRGASPD